MESRIRYQFFKHYFNAMQDEKLIVLLKDEGWEGVGLWWGLLELLGPIKEHRLATNYDILAWNMHADADMLKRVVEKYGLFTIEDGYFFNNSFMAQMEDVEERYNRRASAGSLGGKAKANKQNRSDSAGSDPRANDSNAKEIRSNAIANNSNACSNKEIKENRREEKKLTKKIANNNDNNKKEFLDEKNKPSAPRHFDERVTDEEFLDIVARYMRKGAKDPWEETVHLIDLMHPSWKGQYEDFIECKADASQCWEIKRDRKYINCSRLTVSECQAVDEYIRLSKLCCVFDRLFFSAYRGMIKDNVEKKIIILTSDKISAEAIARRFGKSIAAVLKDWNSEYPEIVFRFNSK